MIFRAFSRSAASYDAAAALQREVSTRLLESLEYLGERTPQVVLGQVLGLGLRPPPHALFLALATGRENLDALHLATFQLARRHLAGLELLTADDKLRAAAGAAG